MRGHVTKISNSIMAQPKENQHYRLSLNKAIQDYKDGIITATGLVFYTVGIYRKPGHKLRVQDIEEFCREIGVSRAAFYKAISKLKVKGRLNWEAIGGVDLWIPESNVVEIQTGEEVSTDVESESTNVETLSTDVESESTNVETLSTDVESESTNVDEECLEWLQNKDSEDSSYISQSSTNISQSSTKKKKKFEKISKEQKKEFRSELKALRINPDNANWALANHPYETIRSAIAYLKQQPEKYQNIEIFVSACKEGRKPQQWQTEAQEEFNPITPEAQERLEAAISEGYFKELIWSNLHSCWKVVFSTGKQMAWWEAIEYLEALSQ
jgi:hypothetical protein